MLGRGTAEGAALDPGPSLLGAEPPVRLGTDDPEGGDEQPPRSNATPSSAAAATEAIVRRRRRVFRFMALSLSMVRVVARQPV